jgi:pimeloyl-ACP methyl ester carboxylesterase
MRSRSILILIIIILFYSCSSKNDGVIGLDNFTELNSQSEGSGTFPFVYNSNANKILDVYCHIPENSDSSTPIVFLFHGNNRNANDYRNSLVAKANLYGFILLVPEFTTTQFPGGDGYNLGNVFTDGDNPSASSLNNESEWAFSVIEPLFTYAIQNLNNQSSKYHIIGHSAGAQFAHRFLFFKPLARIDKMVASASGWYTTLDLETNFPYGINASPLEDINFSLLFSKQLTILVGSNDNDPNSSALRHNSIVDLQGLNRLDRAISFYNNAQSKAADLNVNFEWDFVINPNEDHNYLIAVSKASDIIFNP